MSANAPDLYGKQYASTVMLLLQQKGSRLRGTVMEGSHKGDQASPVDQVGAVEMQPVTTRFGAINRVDPPLARRWASPQDHDLAQLMDSFDDLKLLTDPKSKYVLNAMYAAGRKMDDVILEAMFGNALTGTTGSSSVAFAADGGSTVDVDAGASSDIGLTVYKLRQARRILMAAEVDIENDPLYVAVTARQHDNLLAQAQIISTDFNEKPVLVDGKIERFLGFNFVHTERIDVDGNADERIPAWAKSGMHLGIWQDMVSKVSQRDDLTSLPWQAYLKLSIGATRLEGAKVVEILCDPN